MHQDCLSSAVYSSLIKPAPVVYKDGIESAQCGTSRKSKTSCSVPVEPVVDKGRDWEGLIPTPVGGEEEEEAMAYRESSELQLQQVSRGAHKLTRMIDSLSKAPNLDGRSKYIADDLMRGALDLQESLIMLGRLQEASKVMAERKRKPKPDLMEERKEAEEEFDFQFMGSRRFAEISGCNTRLQEPRLSLDGSARNCGDELKKVIRDSLHRQSLLSNSFDDEKGASSRSLNFPSSSRFGDFSYERKKAVNSISATAQPKKAKAPNLIAKLMGLEEVPSETVEPIKKEQEKTKMFNPPRTSFDIELPKATKPQSIDKNPDRKQKTLQEIIGTMQSKGLLKSGQVEDQRVLSRFSTPSHSDRYNISTTSHSDRYGANVLKDDESPPIVIMKPLHLPCWERGEAPKDLLSGKASGQEEIQSVKLSQEKKVSDHEWMLPKTLERKEAKRMEKTRAESFQKADTRATEFHKPRRKEASGTFKKSDEGQKPPLKGKKQEEKKDVKVVRASITQEKTASAPPTKPDKRPPVAKKFVQRERNVNFPVKPASRSSMGSSKEKKTSGANSVRRSTTTNQVNNSEDGKANNSLPATGIASTTNTSPADDLNKLLAEQEHIPCNNDGISKDPLIFCEVMPKTSQSGKRSESAEKSLHLPAKLPTITRSAGIEDDLKRLLLSSKSFLSFAWELFGLDAHQPIYHRRKVLDAVITRNAKLFLDCGKELLARKSHQLELSNHRMLQAQVWDRTAYTSLDRLVDEISIEIEKRISYTVVDGNDTSEESLYTRLERDMRCKELTINAMWDIGWRNWICAEESEQVVSEVEERIVSVLIDEIVMEFVY